MHKIEKKKKVEKSEKSTRKKVLGTLKGTGKANTSHPHLIPPADSRLQNKYLYTSVKSPLAYVLKVTESVVQELYTFRARLLWADADTLIVRVDQGFGVWTEQSLRLKGIDAPELSTLAGRRAKHWVQERLGTEPCLVVKTHKAKE
ncbi:MAG: hypothetical protein ACLFPX_06295 [Candidatus Omnitrophota bacterium]